MFGLFNKKKKFQAHCDLSKASLDRDSTYLISSAQIISSKKFWDNVMTEPDTMTYTEAHFKQKDQTARNIRQMIFNRYAQEDKVWAISDSQIHLFNIDEDQSREWARAWWDSAGNSYPGHLSTSLADLDEATFTSYKKYAIEEAGKQLVNF